MLVALTHDVDRTKKTYQYGSQFLKSLKTKDLAKMKYHIQNFFSENNPYWNFNEIIRIEESYGVKSTFFFLNESIKFNPFRISDWKLSLGRYKINDPEIVTMINFLDKNGWEIGVHGSFNSYKNMDLLEKEKKFLEKIVEHKIIGTRQHYLNLNDTTWRLHKELGFLYDSTWGFTRNIGFKDNKIQPFFPFNDKFAVFPLTIMDVCYMKFPKKERWRKFMKIIEQIEKNNGILVLNWHQRVFNENEFPDFRNEYMKIIEYLLKNKAIFYKLGDFYKEFIMLNSKRLQSEKIN